MLKRNNRSLKRKDFEWLKENGLIYQGPLFGLLSGESGEKESRFGVVVSKKLSKKAVERNRVRRLIYAAVGNKRKILGTKGYLMVFLAKKNLLESKSEEVEKEVEKMFEEVNKGEKDNSGTIENL